MKLPWYFTWRLLYKICTFKFIKPHSLSHKTLLKIIIQWNDCLFISYLMVLSLCIWLFWDLSVAITCVLNLFLRVRYTLEEEFEYYFLPGESVWSLTSKYTWKIKSFSLCKPQEVHYTLIASLITSRHNDRNTPHALIRRTKYSTRSLPSLLTMRYLVAVLSQGY